SRRSYPIENANPLIIGLAVSVILIVSRIRLGARSKKVFAFLASASFGAFLVHVFFLELFFERLLDIEAGPVLLVVQYLGHEDEEAEILDDEKHRSSISASSSSWPQRPSRSV